MKSYSEKKALRILQVVTTMERAGLETMLMNYYRAIDRDTLQFDFLVHREKPGAYEPEINALGGRIYRVPRIYGKGYTAALRTFFKQHNEYSIVHAHLDALSAPVLRAAKKAGISARIAHSHVCGFDHDAKLPLRLIAKWCIPLYATDFWGCSQAAIDFMFGAQRSPGHVLRNAIDTEAFRFSKDRREAMRTQLSISKDTFVIGHVGRFYPPKNHAFLLEIFRAYYKRHPNSLLLCVGDGPLRASIEEKAKGLPIQFLGVREDIADTLQAMDAFVLPSIYEGLGIAAIEAQASGLPCLLSDGVASEAFLTDYAKKMCLSSGSEIWAESLAVLPQKPREEAFVLVQPYDIHLCANELQQRYLSMAGETVPK